MRPLSVHLPSFFRERHSGVAKVAAAAMIAALCALAAPAGAGASTPATVRHMTLAQLHSLRSTEAPAAGLRAAGRAAQSHARGGRLPTFSSSYTVDGVTFPYTMLGANPASGRKVHLKTVIVPLRMVFTGFTKNAVFDPAFAVKNIVRSPIYNKASFPNGRGQFVDQLQRATFWNKMDRKHHWHVLLSKPKVSKTFTIHVTPATGTLFDLNGSLLGDMNIADFDARLHVILPTLKLDPDETPLFVTQSSIADALGYHDAFLVPDGKGGQRPQTLMYSSWLDPAQVGSLLGDVSTLNHEAAEWVNDPFINNGAPLWAFPPFNKVCGDNPFVEVGDPIGNGPDFAEFPTIPVALHGYTYHLQGLSLLQWFSREVPSSALHGWYSFPDPTQLTSPSVDCPA